MAKQTYRNTGSVCGSIIEAVQKNKNILNSLAAIIHKNEHHAASNSKKFVHPWCVWYLMP